jgi:DNA-binding transcriptional ArsR family regulator
LILTLPFVAWIINELVNNQARTSAVFAALADPTRRRILRKLSVSEPSTVTDLAQPFRISPPAISRHLRVLERAGLIKRQREGRVHFIRAQAHALRDAQQWIENCSSAWQFSFDKLDALLRQQKGTNT